MRTAREVAHAIVCERQDSNWCHWSSNRDEHAHYCDSLTDAIEARDAEYEAEKEKLREFIAGCVKLGGAQGAALEVATRRLKAIRDGNVTPNTFPAASLLARGALTEITRLLGETGETKPEGGRG